jgi:cathepsin D
MDSQVSWVSGLSRFLLSKPTQGFWEALYNANNLSEPLFSFYLERYVNDSANQISAAPGGVLTLAGGTNLYNGSIEYLDSDLTGPPSYWSLTVSCQYPHSIVL